MNNKRIGTIVVLGLLLFAGVYWFLNSPQYKLFRAEGFMDSLWVEDLQLYKESPSSNKVWIKPDNYIMYKFKEGPKRTQKPDISPNIRQGRIEVIAAPHKSAGQNGVEEMFVESVEGYDIYTEIEGDVMLDWLEYADLRGYACLSHLKRWGASSLNTEDLFEALRYLRDFSLLWDGQGFNDKDFTVEGKYAVFKNAIYVYCVKLLDKISKIYELYSLPEIIEYQDIHKILPEVESMLWKAQDLGSGGFHPHYISGTGLGEVNAETTAWVLLAYEWLVSDSTFG